MEKLLDFFYPPGCQLCGDSQNTQYAGQLCRACVADLRLNLNACTVCGLPINLANQALDTLPSCCGQCLQAPPVYDLCWSPFIYAQPLEWMIQQLKFNAKLNFASLLSALLADSLPAHLCNDKKPDVIIPMPLHSQRLKHRGFNQSYLLIKPLAKSLGIPVDLNSCVRVKNTEHQTGKNARQRQLNIKNAFTFSNKKHYRHVVIFDDVVTTGSSVSELSRILKREGVEKVDIWSLARAEK